jgi:hypothetical protein
MEALDGRLSSGACDDQSFARFSPELVTIMKAALDTAVHRIDRSHRTPATKAKMAQRIVRSASEGVTDLLALMSVALEEGREPAA